MRFIALYENGWRIFATTYEQAEVLASRAATAKNPLLCVSEYKGIIGDNPLPTDIQDAAWAEMGSDRC